MHNEMNITVREAYKNASQESRIFQKNYSFYRRLYGQTKKPEVLRILRYFLLRTSEGRRRLNQEQEFLQFRKAFASGVL